VPGHLSGLWPRQPAQTWTVTLGKLCFLVLPFLALTEYPNILILPAVSVSPRDRAFFPAMYCPKSKNLKSPALKGE